MITEEMTRGTGTDKEQFKEAFVEKLQTMRGKSLDNATALDKYLAVSGVVQEHINKKWAATNQRYKDNNVKQAYYFSMEFLIGRLLGSNLLNLDLLREWSRALEELGIDINELETMEPDAGLGNGGLGRLAACFMDSLASLGMPGHGFGIRYKYGHFHQKIVNGYQAELPDNWLKEGNVWEIRRPEQAVLIKFGGRVEVEEQGGKMKFSHCDYDAVLAVPYDTPIVGFRNNTINTLRLWNAETPIRDFELPSCNHGDYVKAVEYKQATEAISQVLYPDDSKQEGQLLRLKQEYFLSSAGVQSIIEDFKKQHGSLEYLMEKVAFHINDTHPTLVIPELMRILLDEEGMDWEQAWTITTNTVSYTNHTTLVEALEKWPVKMFKQLLPRIYMIVQEINERFCRELWQRYPGDWDRIAQMAIISHGYIKMANLAIAGSYSVNGVAKLHTEILKRQEMKSFYQFTPHKFNNKTNGITHRRWMLRANPKLSNLITETIGSCWIKHPEDLSNLKKHLDDPGFQERLYEIKRENKKELATLIRDVQGIKVDVDSIFDVQIKRLHAYKRQILNALHIMYLYNRLRENPDWDMVPRTFIFGAKAAPAYHIAKLTIKLINTIADKVNNDKAIKDKLKVVFMENYRVSLAERIIPAAEVSEQISTASKEASGTGNMKLMANGALTIGTLDGANVEIKDVVGDDNMYIFGLTANEVLDYYQNGGYCSWTVYNEDMRLKTVLDQLINGFFPVGHSEFRDLHTALLHYNDEFFVLKDFDSYAKAHMEIDRDYRDQRKWQRMSAVNIANSGNFSSDQTIYQYATDIWQIKPS